MANIAGYILGGVFLVAGITKLRSPLDTRRSLRDLGFPFPKEAGIALPLVELLTSALLFIDPGTGGPCAVALLVAFTVLIFGRLTAGNTSGCGCFGAWSTRPLSYKDIVRNTIFIILGAVATLG
ncbi:MAG TPA: DoxX family membrane protein [Acidimicrobiales bacterium]|nr:DoxX family membrane protein [Acidimicrobiales bacterium]|tara:strand:+ start:617 stop:988 length:372 start_codon:yes stop_codon:yes gene_type:complete